MTGKRLEARNILITGGGTGIGKGIAVLFAKEGAKVLIVGRREEELYSTVSEIHGAGGTADSYVGDVTSSRDVELIVEYICENFGPVDTLINNAGVVRRNEIVELTTEEEWNWQMDINLRGVFHTTRSVLPVMLKQGKGVIINIASTAAFFGASGYATYSATKGGVVAFTRAIAMQYAGKGIRANVVSPGLIHTPMSYVDTPDFDRLVDQYVKEDYPIKRVGKPEDVAYAALFFASDEASWITGQNLFVDGGFSAK